MKAMWKAVTVLLAITMVAGCGEPGQPEFDVVITMEEGSSITVPDFTVVTFLESNDSRCPANANCVWEGRADVTLSFNVEGEPQEVALNDVEKKVVTQSGYRFEFLELNPFPVLQGNDSEVTKTLKFQVAKIED